MKLQVKVLRITLIVMTIFISISALSGGISLLFGIIDLPLKQLEGSIFKDYTIPGLALSLIVGGSMLLATILLIRKSRYALLSSISAGIIMMVFEFVEVLEFGSPLGIARQLQILYFGLGLAVCIVSLAISLIDLRSQNATYM